MIASQRNRALVKLRSEDWLKRHILAIAQNPERVDFIGETSVKANRKRVPGWAPCGHGLEMDALFNSWDAQI